MSSIQSSCNELTTVLGNKYKCEVVSGTKIRLSGFPELAIGTLIKINVRATASALTTGQICATAWEDTPAVPTP